MSIPEATHDSGGEIACPYCLTKHGDLYEYGLDGDNSVDIECGECGRAVRLSLRITYKYTATPIVEKA